MSTEYPVWQLCRAFNVARSGYYRWLRQPLSRRSREDAQLRCLIADVFLQSRRTYGSPRICQELRARGLRHGRRRVGRIMREQSIAGRSRRRRKPRTTESLHDQPIAPNLLKQSFAPTRPDQVWVTDITYVSTGEGWLYVAAILDLFSRRVVGWAFSSNLHTEICLEALAMAQRQRRPAKGLIHHSDRGCQYASANYRSALRRAGFQPSMSRRGNCYDNAVAESFWSTLKAECVERCEFPTRAAAQCTIFNYIEAFYNRRRRHSSLGYLSPLAFESNIN